MSTIWRHLAGGLLALAGIAVLVNCLIGAWVFDGWDGADAQCYRVASVAGVDGPVRYEGAWTVFPLGLTCSVDTPGDGQPVSQRAFARWDLTVIALAAAPTAIVGLLALLVPTRTELRRFMRAIDPPESLL